MRRRVWVALTVAFGSVVALPNAIAASPIPAPKVISSGDEHTCVIVAGGSLKCWGGNLNGGLGDGTLNDAPAPVPATTLTGVTTISAGFHFTCAVRSDATIGCWGLNADGELGNGTNADSFVPTTVTGISTATSISAGGGHACATLGDTTVRCWGANGHGQLGNGSTSDSNTPVVVVGITGAVGVTAGLEFSCAVLVDTTVRCWGNNVDGALGNGMTTDSSIPVVVSGLTGATAVSALGSHACALLDTGTVRCWGFNGFGELGNSTTTNSTVPVTVTGLSGVAAISVGEFHSCALLANATVRCWGDNTDGELGDGSTISASNPVTVSGLANVTAIAAGGYSTCAVISDATARCWGDNSVGALGDGTNLSSATPVVVSGLTSIAQPNGSLYVPLSPSRLLETRTGLATTDGQFNAIGPRTTGTTTELTITGRANIPTTATAAVLNITVTEPQNPGYITIWPCGEPRPNASNLNYTTSTTIANLVITKIGANGKICLYTQATTHLIADINGYYPAASTFTPLTPSRLLETRTGLATTDGQFNAIGPRTTGTTTELTITGRANIPTTATAAVLNITVTEPQNPGYITIWPCGEPRPNASNLNYTTSTTIANLVITKIGANGKICLYTQATTHLIADINGYYPA